MALEQIGLEAVLQDENFQAGLKRYMAGLGQATTQTEKSAGGMSMLGHTLSTAVGSAVGFLTATAIPALVGGMGDLVRGAIAGNAEFERYNVQFTTLLGSADDAKRRLEELADFGAKTPFELPEVVQADKILQGFGLHSQEAARQFGFSGAQIRTIAGDVAAGTGASFQDMSMLLGRFSTGATGEALARMAELGITSKTELAKMGLEFSKSGELLTPLPQAMNTVLTLMKQKYGGLMDAQSKTFEGMISNLNDWWGQTKRKIAEPIFDVVKEQLGKLLDFLGSPEMQNAITSIAGGLAFVAGHVASVVSGLAKLSSGGGGLATALGISPEMISSAQSIGATLAQISKDAMPAFSEAMQNIGAELQRVGADVMPFVNDMLKEFSAWFTENAPLITRYITLMAQRFAYIAERVIAMWKIAKPAIEGLMKLILNLAKLVMQISTGDWKGAWETIKKTVSDAWDSMKKITYAFFDWIAGFMKTSLDEIGRTWKNNWDMFLAILVAAWSAIKKAISDALDAIAKFISDTWNDIKATAQRAWSAIGDVLRDALNALNNIVKAGLEAIRNIMLAAWDFITSDTQTKWEMIRAAIGSALANIVTAVTAGFESIKQAIASAWTAIRDGVQAAWDEITAAIRAAIEAIPALVSAAIASLASIGQAIVSTIRAALETAWNIGQRIGELIKGIYTYIASGNFFDDVKRIGGDIVGAIKQGIELLWNEAGGVVEAIGGLLSGMWESFKDLDLRKVGEQIINAIIDGIKANWKYFVDWLLGAIGGLFARGETPPEGESVGRSRTNRGIMQGAAVSGFGAGVTTNNTRNIYITVNPTYEQVASPATIRYDIAAALVAAGV